MPQGIYVDGRRPKSKKAVKEAVAEGPLSRVRLEAVSIFGDDYDGSLENAPDGHYTFVVPSPQERKSFGSIDIKEGRVVIK